MLKKYLYKVVQKLKEEGCEFALAGGMVASLYREEERLTKDLDFLILSHAGTNDVVKNILESFDLMPTVLRQADLAGGPMFAIKRKTTKPYMIAGRSKDNTKIGLDFILPEMPWFEKALIRSQDHQINFGLGPIPCLTVEDIIVAKLFAVQTSLNRFKDFDDLISIFKANHELDLVYLASQINSLKLEAPKEIKKYLPKEIKLIIKMKRV